MSIQFASERTHDPRSFARLLQQRVTKRIAPKVNSEILTPASIGSLENTTVATALSGRKNTSTPPSTTKPRSILSSPSAGTPSRHVRRHEFHVAGQAGGAGDTSIGYQDHRASKSTGLPQCQLCYSTWRILQCSDCAGPVYLCSRCISTARLAHPYRGHSFTPAIHKDPLGIKKPGLIPEKDESTALEDRSPGMEHKTASLGRSTERQGSPVHCCTFCRIPLPTFWYECQDCTSAFFCEDCSSLHFEPHILKPVDASLIQGQEKEYPPDDLGSGDNDVIECSGSCISTVMDDRDVLSHGEASSKRSSIAQNTRREETSDTWSDVDGSDSSSEDGDDSDDSAVVYEPSEADICGNSMASGDDDSDESDGTQTNDKEPMLVDEDEVGGILTRRQSVSTRNSSKISTKAQLFEALSRAVNELGTVLQLIRRSGAGDAGPRRSSSSDMSGSRRSTMSRSRSTTSRRRSTMSRSRSTISNALLDFDVDLAGGSGLLSRGGRRRQMRTWSPQDRRQLSKMKRKGYSNEDIAKELSRTPGAVSQQWRKQRPE